MEEIIQNKRIGCAAAEMEQKRQDYQIEIDLDYGKNLKLTVSFGSFRAFGQAACSAVNEIDQIRAALNEYRTIFYNKKDGIFYGAITNLYQKTFNSKQPNATMRIEALTQAGQDLSAEYLEHLKSRKKAIRYAIERSDFDYIYNGVLQHADGRYAMQMVKEYTDGSLAYLLLKNVLIAQGLKDLLSEHYKVINVLNFPKMGPL